MRGWQWALTYCSYNKCCVEPGSSLDHLKDVYECAYAEEPCEEDGADLAGLVVVNSIFACHV